MVRRGDVIIAAVGIAEFVKGSWVKEGAIVIDVGINFKEHPDKPGGLKMCGDVDFDAASAVRGVQITPVPGGVGPLTVAMLMRNTLNNARARAQKGKEGSK